MNNKLVSKVLRNIYVLTMILIIYLFIVILNKLNIIGITYTLLKVLSPLFVGIVISWLIRPTIEFLESKKINRTIALILIYLIMIFSLYILIITCIPKFIIEIDEFIKLFPNILNNFFDKLNIKFINLNMVKSNILEFITEFLNNTTKDLPIKCINIIGGVSSFILGLIISFYLLISKLDFSNYITSDINKLLNKINNLLHAYVRGTIFSSFIVFVLSTIIFYIFKFNSALLLGFICGITNIIPFIGPYVGGVIPVLIAFTKSITFGILITVIIIIIQTIEGNIIHPLIMSKSLKIHPVTSIVSLLIFGYFFGIIGMIIAVPLVAIIKEIYFYYNNIKRRRKYGNNSSNSWNDR